MHTSRVDVNTLPPEVLGQCFEYLRLRDRIRATKVCSRWRSIALDHAELWRDLEDVGMAGLQTFLPRTKRVGVRIAAHVAAEWSIDALCKLILPHMDHISLLDLDMRPRDDLHDWTAVRDVLSAEAPQLEAFSLVIHQPPTALNLDVPLFGGVAPKLRSLRMEGWMFTVRSAVTQNVVALYAPGVMHAAGSAQASYPLYASSWAGVFPAVRELHLTALSELVGLRSPTNAFPAYLRTLVLEFTESVAPSVAADAFHLLHEANFARMREVTLIYSPKQLVELVLQSLGEWVVSLELADRHLRLITESGTAINFLRASVLGLDDVIFMNISRFAKRLRTLHLGAGVLSVFDGVTLARLCVAAQGIERLVLTGVPNPELWDRWDVLNLPALREMHVLGPRTIRADDLAGFVRERLRRAPGSAPTLTLDGVPIVDNHEGCTVPCRMLVELLRKIFREISVDPSVRPAKTQRADMFARVPRVGEKTIWISQVH